jgi:hypothetical protein
MNKIKIIVLLVGGLIIVYFGVKILRSISVVGNLAVLRTDHFVISYHGIALFWVVGLLFQCT